MGHLIRVDERGNVLSIKAAPLYNDYDVWNAQQAQLHEAHEREQRRIARTKEQLIKEQQKRAQLMEEYQGLKKLYFKTTNDRRLKSSTRKARQMFIIEAMINIEELICV